MEWRMYIRFCFIWISLLFLFFNSLVVSGSGTDDRYVFNESKITIEGSLRPFEATVNLEEVGMQRYVVNIYIHSSFPALPPSFKLKVKFPKDKINQLWSSNTWSNKSYFSLPSYDRAAANFSIISGLTINDQNQITFTCRDRYNAKFVSSNIQEENDTLEFSLGFFEENPPLSNMQDYSAEVLVDFRNVHFSKAIYDASHWFWEEKFKNAVPTVDTTNVPVFSTWYPMHRNIPFDNIIREMDSLRTFNFRSILVDDGWQALVRMKVDTVFSYEPESYQTMKNFMQKCDKLDMNLYFWYSIPFLGGNPVILKKFDGKYIRYKAPRQMYVLDPRYPDVRQYIVGTYANFLAEWQFDGYWFDFLNGFYPKEGSVLSQDIGRDYMAIDLAVDVLNNDLESRLKAIKEDVFLGQNFAVVGPDRTSYQSFLSGFVGADRTQIVREKMVNNRLLYGKFTPFMEVVSIHYRDRIDEIARKIQSVIFGNPYLSFFITTLPEDSKQTIRFWLNYWKENHDVLFDGTFEPMQVSRFYPVVLARNERKSIYSVYEDYTLNLPINLESQLDVINSKQTESIKFLISKADIFYNYEIFDASGKSIEGGVMKTKKKNLIEFLVPFGGFIRISPM